MEKEQAMHERFSRRIEEGLQSLTRRIEKSKKLLARGELERQIGRLLERNSRAAGRYAIVIGEDKAGGAGVKLQWSKRSEWDDWAKLSEGTYILRSNIHDWTDEELWKTYIQLSEAKGVVAIKAVAHKLCRACYYIMRDRVAFNITKAFGPK